MTDRVIDRPDLLAAAPLAPLVVPAHLSPEQKEELYALLALRERKRRENMLAHYRPYPKQREFHEAGAAFRERLFMAGNQLGKTISGAAEVAMHLTGRYPDWWKGLRLQAANRGITGSESVELTKKGVQRLRQLRGALSLVIDNVGERCGQSGYEEMQSLIMHHLSQARRLIVTTHNDAGWFFRQFGDGTHNPLLARWKLVGEDEEIPPWKEDRP